MDLRLELIPLPSTMSTRARPSTSTGWVSTSTTTSSPATDAHRPADPAGLGLLGRRRASASVDPGRHPVTGLHLVVDDIEAARAELPGRGVDVSGVDDMGGVKYAYFSDPDGNSWALQEIPGRRGRRVRARRPHRRAVRARRPHRRDASGRST